LQQNGERDVTVVGTDMSERRGGRLICDAFHIVPPGSSDEFAPFLIELAEREQVDVVLPLSSFEVAAVAGVADRFEVPVLVASLEAIAACNDKSQTTALAERLGIPVPRSIVASTPDQLRDAAVALGYPDVAVCIKPTNLKGSRGFLVVSANTNRRWHILEARPGPLPLTLEETIEAIGSEHEFPSMLVMDYIQGPEHTVDAICRGGRFVLGHAKTREAVRAGLAMVGELAIDWFVNLQFIGGRLLEINPRISTIVYQEDLNLPYLAVRHAVGEIDEEELAAMSSRVRTTRRAIRYYDQLEYDDG
jgi:carbamoyl-phosphate synthase large subunit